MYIYLHIIHICIDTVLVTHMHTVLYTWWIFDISVRDKRWSWPMWVTLAQCCVSRAWLLGPQEIVEKVSNRTICIMHVCSGEKHDSLFYTGSYATPSCVYICELYKLQSQSPYQPTGIMECHEPLEHCWFEGPSIILHFGQGQYLDNPSWVEKPTERVGASGCETCAGWHTYIWNSRWNRNFSIIEWWWNS